MPSCWFLILYYTKADKVSQDVHITDQHNSCRFCQPRNEPCRRYDDKMLCKRYRITKYFWRGYMMTKLICAQQKICKTKKKISVNKFIFRRMAKRHKPGRKWPDNAIQEENWKRWQVSIIIISKLENEENEHKNIWKMLSMAISIHRNFLIVISLKVCKHSAGLVRFHGKLHKTKQCHRDIWGVICVMYNQWIWTMLSFSTFWLNVMLERIISMKGTKQQIVRNLAPRP